MNEAKRDSCYTMTVLSRKRATSDNASALTVYGGVNVGNNMYIKNEMYAGEVVSRGNMRVSNNLYVMGTIEADKMFHVSDEEILFMKDIVPENSKTINNIGSKERWWNELYVNKINTKIIDVSKLTLESLEADDIEIGRNGSEPCLSVGSDIVVNSDMSFVNREMEPFITINQNKQLLSTNMISLSNILFSEQIVTVCKDFMDLELKSDLILINSKVTGATLNIVKSEGFEGIRVVKVVYAAGSNVKLKHGSNSVIMEHRGEYVDCLYTGSRLYFLQKKVV